MQVDGLSVNIKSLIDLKTHWGDYELVIEIIDEDNPSLFTLNLIVEKVNYDDLIFKVPTMDDPNISAVKVNMQSKTETRLYIILFS